MDAQQQRDVAEGLRSGKPEAWRALYDAYAPRVWRNVARMVGRDAAAVADIVQDTFLAAARSASRYDPDRGSLALWLSGIALNHVRLFYRRQSRSERTGAASRERVARNGELVGWLEGREPAPPDVLESAELSALVRSTLCELSDEYASLLTAKYLEGATMQHIADERDVTLATINSKLARARNAFREKFSRLSGEAQPGKSHEVPSDVARKAE